MLGPGWYVSLSFITESPVDEKVFHGVAPPDAALNLPITKSKLKRRVGVHAGHNRLTDIT